MSINITVRQILDLVACAGYDTTNLHAQTGKDEFDTEITIDQCPPNGLIDDDGKPDHYELIAYFTEYPEDGCLGLGERIEPPNVKPADTNDSSEYMDSLGRAVNQLNETLKQRDELLAAMKKAADQIRVCDYTPARSTLLVALENAKPAKGGA
jgi:hypothetical protein